MPQLSQAAQQAIQAMPAQAQPQIVNGEVVFPERNYLIKLAWSLSQTAMQLGNNLFAISDILDLEAQVPVSSGQILFRIVTARNGRSGDTIGTVRYTKVK